MDPKPVSDSSVTMTELVLPSHANPLGTVFGGVIMSWIDICAAIAAQRHARRVVVTASIDMLHFRAPITVGCVVHLKAQVNHAWHSSMEVGVRVDGENPLTGETRHAATAYLTYVALDEKRRPVEVPAVLCETPEQERRSRDAQARREKRLANRSIGEYESR
ncbi:MAG TPA: acyl-CoA thioesterase [Candidatus Latescibacteria bacterium]|nr:acyl-CoA thioesterase [Candidatus Latescibacterota bacterium]HQE62789.1 acyl-CoA thioesterase [Candidatus Latescibacterota bacterium]HQI75879.1 acyl-CoA thioesterase [Candidatus Latescibacterota bacterium]HQK22828.1 acyl-CoA thioesterase [Candidatus Latescibacterota bacterium]